MHLVQMFQLKVHSLQVKHDKLIIPTHGISERTGQNMYRTAELSAEPSLIEKKTQNMAIENFIVYTVNVLNILMCTGNCFPHHHNVGLVYM